MSTSDTTNVVSFEITPAGVFNFWKNRGQDRTSPVWAYPSQYVIGYRRVRNMTDRRNTLYGVGANPRDATLQTTAENATDQTNNGRREEGLLYTWVRDTEEIVRVTSHRLKRAVRDDSDLSLSFAPNNLIPWRGSGAGYELGDRVRIRIGRGLTSVNALMMVTGQQVIMNRGSEYVRVFLQDTL